MEYNETLFGTKIPIYDSNQHNNLSFYCASQNISLQSGYTSEDFQMNVKLPDDLFYWQISCDSPYSARSYLTRRGSSGSYTYNKYNSEKGIDNIPIVLVAGKPKRNAQYNFDPSGSYDGNVAMHAYGFNSVSESVLKESNNSNPLWYYTSQLGTQPSQGYWNGYPWIVDFDYNNMLVEILVSINGGSTIYTLADYIANRNVEANKINFIGIQIYAGTSDDKEALHTRKIIRSMGYNENGIQIIDSGICVPFLTDNEYKLPEYVREVANYSKDGYITLRGFSSSNAYAMLFSGAVTTSSNSFYTSYLLEDDRWICTGGETQYTLIKHGENGTYSNSDFDYIRKLIAYIGFWFTDGGNLDALLGENALQYDENEVPTGVYQAVIRDGVTTGEFIPLSTARDNEQSKWGSDWRDKNGYDGRTAGSNTPESNKSSRKTYSTALTSFGKIYLCTKNNIDSLALALKNLVTDDQNPYDPSLFYDQNPVDCIINIKEYPIDISSCIEYTSFAVEPIYLGRWTPVVDPLDSQYQKYMARACDIKSSDTPFSYTVMGIPHKFKDIGYEFLDYEPYSVYHLYLPFCGTVKIPSELAVDTKIEILYFADVLSGACIVHIYINDKYYCSAQGQLSVDIPVSGYQVSEYTKNMLNATYAQKQAYANIARDVGRIASAAGSAGITLGITDKRAFGNRAESVIPGITAGNLTKLGGLVSGLGSAIQAGADMWSNYETIKYNKTILEHSAPAPIKSTLGGGIVNWESPYYVEMLVERPLFIKGFDEVKYTSLVGKACYLADTLSNHSGGYVEAINCNLSGFPATQPEKVELAKLLADGVFL